MRHLNTKIDQKLLMRTFRNRLLHYLMHETLEISSKSTEIIVVITNVEKRPKMKSGKSWLR